MARFEFRELPQVESEQIADFAARHQVFDVELESGGDPRLRGWRGGSTTVEQRFQDAPVVRPINLSQLRQGLGDYLACWGCAVATGASFGASLRAFVARLRPGCGKLRLPPDHEENAKGMTRSPTNNTLPSRSRHASWRQHHAG